MVERKYRYPLERGWAKRRLQWELARMEKPQEQLATEYGVSGAAITKFKQRHAGTIAEIQADIENEFAGLWIARKQDRMAEYEEEMARIEDSISNSVGSDRVRWTKLKAQLLVNAANEMGHLVSRLDLQGEVGIRYEVVGIDPESLK